jgi:hypothetical protein
MSARRNADNRRMLEFILGYHAGSRTASRAASLARSAAVADGTAHSNRVEDLNERIDEFALILRGVWALLEEGGVTTEQLMAKLEELDMQDGVSDGRMRKGPIECPSCESKVAPGLSTCQFCGADIDTGDSDPLGGI